MQSIAAVSFCKAEQVHSILLRLRDRIAKKTLKEDLSIVLDMRFGQLSISNLGKVEFSNVTYDEMAQTKSVLWTKSSQMEN